jgi:hypothetical protein
MIINISIIKSIFKKKYLLLKIFSITVMVLWGFGQPFIFNRYLSTENFSFITVGYGVILFLDLFDLGISRYIYADIRDKFVNKIEYKSDLVKILKIYSWILIYSTLILILFLLIVSIKLKNSFSSITIILWSVGIILNAGFAYFRYVLFSIDEYILYEKLDILRKGVNFLLLLIVIFDKSFFLFSIFSIAILIVIYYKIFKMLLQKHQIKYTNPFSSFSDTIQLFVFYIKKIII